MPKTKMPKVSVPPVFLTIKDDTIVLAKPGDQLYSFKNFKDGTIEFTPTKSKKRVAAITEEGFVLISIKDGEYSST